MSRANFDVAILGGGPAGTAAAISLLKYAGLRVIVLESSDYNARLEGQTISPSVLPLLEYLDARSGFEEDKHLPSYGVSAAWSRDEILSRDSIFNAQGQGWSLDRSRFDRRLARIASELGGLVVTNARTSWSSGIDGTWILSLSRGDEPKHEVVVRFVIDATGHTAVFARSCGACKRVDDRLLAVALVLNGGVRLSQSLLVESVPDGWWYRATLAGGRVAAIFLSDPLTIRRLRVSRAENFLELMRQTVFVKQQLEGVVPGAIPGVKSVYSSLLEPLGSSNWVAAGDAAASFDPLSSAGIGHALYTGIHAARVACGQIMGRTGAFTAYAAGIIHTYEQYRRLRNAYYLQEQRWPNHHFWGICHANRT